MICGAFAWSIKKRNLRDIITGMYALYGAAFVEEAAHMLA